MSNIPQVFAEYISDLEPKTVPFMEFKSVKFNISQEEAIRDFELVCYLLDNAYSGKEYWEKQGISFSKLYQWAKSEIEKSEFIIIHTFFRILCDMFNNIHDGHFSISSVFTRQEFFYKTYQAYFADVLLGTRSWKSVETLEVKANQKIKTVPLHECKKSKPNNSGIFEYVPSGNHSIVKSSRFWEDNGEIYDNKRHDFEELGKSLKEKPFIIWDIHDNGGGNSSYPASFIRGVNDNAEWLVDCAILSSPAIEQAKGKTENLPTERKWSLYEADRQTEKISTYNGTLYLLISDKVASSGEAAVSQAMNVKDCVLIGSNTGGRGTFGDILTYELPISKIHIRLPHKLFLGGPREGEGYTPDFWVDTDDLLCETIKWLDNPETYTAI